ncbi:hypothetical protein D3C86_1857190 [compost metagenome]
MLIAAGLLHRLDNAGSQLIQPVSDHDVQRAVDQGQLRILQWPVADQGDLVPSVAVAQRIDHPFDPATRGIDHRQLRVTPDQISGHLIALRHVFKTLYRFQHRMTRGVLPQVGAEADLTGFLT